MDDLKRIVTLALSHGVPARAFFMALVIGTILNLINQGDALLGGGAIHWGKLGLTYLVPYFVSTHASVATRLKMSRTAP